MQSFSCLPGQQRHCRPSSSTSRKQQAAAVAHVRLPGTVHRQQQLQQLLCKQQSAAVAQDDPGEGEMMATVELIEKASSAAPPLQMLNKLNAPRWVFRTVACLILGGQVVSRILKGKIHWRNTRDQQ
eukprot:GHRQ01007351.1.p2 GENE.GHRQ01007351.1~~GHRQ01007351.1.p2  ORF type:complete len:127 (+),score=61.68 GHRQ01007351.1:375-755(+)